MAQTSNDVYFDQKPEGKSVYTVSTTTGTIIIGENLQVTQQRTNNMSMNKDIIGNINLMERFYHGLQG